MGIIDETCGLIQKVSDIYDRYQKISAYGKETSLPEVTGMTRVEPITIISRDLVNYEHLTDSLNTLLNIFTAYYLQAFKLSTIDNVRVLKALDRLNPNREYHGNLVALEDNGPLTYLRDASYNFQLPTIQTRASIEAINDEMDEKKRSLSAEIDSGVVNELSNLSVGKLIEVSFVMGENKEGKKEIIKIPVQLRLSAATIPNHGIVHTLALKSDDVSFVERWHSWRAGQIKFWKDFVLCQDMINDDKKAMMEDETGISSEIIKRVNKALFNGLLTKAPSLATASNIYVISESVARELEGKMSGKLANARVRQRVFEGTYAMLLLVVDREAERFTLYTRGIALPSEFSLRDIRNSNKSKGPDIMDVLKTLYGGQPASF